MTVIKSTTSRHWHCCWRADVAVNKYRDILEVHHGWWTLSHEGWIWRVGICMSVSGEECPMESSSWHVPSAHKSSGMTWQSTWKKTQVRILVRVSFGLHFQTWVASGLCGAISSRQLWHSKGNLGCRCYIWLGTQVNWSPVLSKKWFERESMIRWSFAVPLSIQNIQETHEVGNLEIWHGL